MKVYTNEMNNFTPIQVLTRSYSVLSQVARYTPFDMRCSLSDAEARPLKGYDGMYHQTNTASNSRQVILISCESMLKSPTRRPPTHINQAR
jgi:hypothetical protein